MSRSPPTRSCSINAVTPHWPRAGLSGDQSLTSLSSHVSDDQADLIATSTSLRLTTRTWWTLPRRAASLSHGPIP